VGVGFNSPQRWDDDCCLATTQFASRGHGRGSNIVASFWYQLQLQRGSGPREECNQTQAQELGFRHETHGSVILNCNRYLQTEIS
jgi:hypothetical protein